MSARAIRRIDTQRDFKLCITHRAKSANVALLGTELPVVGIYHTFGDHERRPRRLLANVFRKRSHLFGVSNEARDEMRACLPSCPVERIQTLYYRIDLQAVHAEQLPSADVRVGLGLCERAWIVGNVGQLQPGKDLTKLIRAFADALPTLPKKSLLVILCGGRLEARLKALAKTLGVSQQFLLLARVPPTRRYFTGFSPFALSSDHEPLGIVPLEAVAAGAPLVRPHRGGRCGVVSEVGLLFDVGDGAALSRLEKVAALNQCALDFLRSDMLKRLERRFTDSAVAPRFFSALLAWPACQL